MRARRTRKGSGGPEVQADQVRSRAGPHARGLTRTFKTLGSSHSHRHGVRVETGVTVEATERRPEAAFEERETGGDWLSVRSDRGSFPAGLVLVSVGVRPNVALAKAAGIALGETGAIRVDAEGRTSAPDSPRGIARRPRTS